MMLTAPTLEERIELARHIKGYWLRFHQMPSVLILSPPLTPWKGRISAGKRAI